MYEKSHLARYEFASNWVQESFICGDFACGTGYGTAIIGNRAKEVLGIDIDERSINVARNRYKSISNIEFRCQNLLDMAINFIF